MNRVLLMLLGATLLLAGTAPGVHAQAARAERPHRFAALSAPSGAPLATPEGDAGGFTPFTSPDRAPAAPERRVAAGMLSLPEDASWEAFVGPGVLNSSPNLIEYHGKLVLTATVAGRVTGGLTLWDGTQFTALPPVPGFASVLGVWNDQLIAANGSTPTGIFAYNGTSWVQIGQANSFIRAIATHGGALIVGGQFTTMDAVPVRGLARFDGVSWTDMGSTAFDVGAQVQSIAEHAGTLVIGGALPFAHNIAAYDDLSGTWQQLGAGFNANVQALVSDGVKLYAAGLMTLSGATTLGGRAVWNGATWSALPGSSITSDQAMAVWNGGVVLKGGVASPSRLGFWNGTTLTPMNDSLGVGGTAVGNVFHLLNWGGKLVASGNFVNVGSKQAQAVAIYDGVSWTPPVEPWSPDMRSPEGPVTDLMVWNSKLIGVGSYALVANGDHWTPAVGISAWDGSSWSALAGGVFAAQRWLGSYQGDLIVTGWSAQARDAGNAVIRNVLRWNGTSWSGVGAAPFDFGLASVEYHGDLYAAHEDFAGDAIRRWNGSVWSIPGGGVVNGGGGDGLTVFGDSLVLSGLFDNVGGTPAQNVAFWDGTAWHAADTGLDGYTYTVAVWNGHLIAGGEFTHSGTRPMSAAAIWDGAAWQPMGTNAVEILRFAVSGGMLFASGDFRLPDNSVIQTVARWDGTEWHPLGSGTNSYGIAVYDGYLYCAGTGLVHGHVSHGISRIPLAATLDAPSPREVTYRVQLSAAPNPVRQTTSLTFSLAMPGHARVSVVDVAGREVAELANGAFAAGVHDVRWSPERAAPGVYFARLTTAHESRVVRLAVIGR